MVISKINAKAPSANPQIGDGAGVCEEPGCIPLPQPGPRESRSEQGVARGQCPESF